MEINLDLYIRNFRIFYQQLIKDHKRQQELNNIFKSLVQSQNRKWKKSFNFKRQTNSRDDNKMLNKLNQKKNGKSKIAVDVLYASQKIEYMIIFGYFFLMLQYKNVSAFNFLCNNLRLELEKRGMLTEVLQRRMNYFWDKIDQAVSGKRKLARFQKILQGNFKDLPTNILDILYSIILQEKQFTSINQMKYIQDISNFLTVKIDYFILEQDENIKIVSWGNDYKITMRFGYFKKEKFYGYVSKMPEKQQSQINNEITLQKFATISQNLNKMYTTNLRQYLTLSNMKIQNKMVRSNSIFSNSTNKPNYTQGNQSEFTSI